MAYPSTIDSLTTKTDNVDIIHAADVNNLQTAVVALETKVGVDGSAVTSTHDYKLGEILTTDKAVGKSATQTLTNKTLTAPTVTGATITTSTVNGVTLQTAGSASDFLAANGSYVAGSVSNASTTAKGIVELATETEMVAGTATGGTGAPLVVTPDIIYKRIKFGGTGADGALSVSSGNTNIDLGAAAFVVKNYTSISITGTGSVTFINPHANGTVIHIKSQGNVTLTSSAAPMLDASGCGASGGAGGVSGVSTAGSNISGDFLMYGTATGGALAVASNDPAGGSMPTNSTFYGFTLRASTLGNERLPVLLVPGAGGAGGSSNNATPVGGAGGNGGGALYIECGGAWNFTTTNGISVVGKNGTAGTVHANRNSGGGGGGCGTFLAYYNTLTANSGTINTTTSSGGAVNPGVGTAYAGGGGASLGAAGSGGNGGTTGGGSGGVAIANAAMVLKNNFIA